MQFKQWLLSEMSYVPLAKGLKTAYGTIDALDLRFEDYPKSTEDERNFARRLMSSIPPPYFAKFPDSNRYLIYNGKTHYIGLTPPPEDYIELPQHFPNGYSWWDYAAGYHGNKLVKKPLRLRVYD